MQCEYCHKPFVDPRPDQRFCDRICRGMFERRADRPNADELHELVWSISTVKIAERFGVSEAAVRKWCRRYGIDKPPRGYWAIKYADEEQGPIVKDFPGDARSLGSRRFSPEQIRYIRESKESSRRMAERIHCHMSTINDIRHYTTYKDIE